MRRTTLGMVITGALGLVLGAAGARAAADPLNRTAVERIVHDYILAHPEIIPEAIERLQNQAASKTIAAERKALETPFAGAWAGNPNGDVTLVMFSDYNCGYCRASMPDIERLLKEDPKLKVVWREVPVLGPQSEAAARDALAAAKQDGRYFAFHRALFAGRPDSRGLQAAAKVSGVDQARLAVDRGGQDVAQEIENNLALAGRLGVTGTPAFVIGTRLLGGAVGHDALAEAIAEARRG
ncbi:DsbA family protein [uncultured Sphingomonas sp.]|uniref:DsbA family protein n=1 Tax=uncultured Sphingomonas sp. TaxID=158754 RepID=UPI0025F55ED1|nr:DsbA family protein [uncultured Sphingomonas sp.]